jgi:hypothetical protein
MPAPPKSVITALHGITPFIISIIAITISAFTDIFIRQAKFASRYEE